MKPAATLVFLLAFVNGHAQFPVPDTIIRSVKVSFQYSNTIFPVSWREAPILASAEAVAVEEVPRCKKIVAVALKKYPLVVLRELEKVYFLKSMSFYQVGYGGTNTTNALYLTDNGPEMGYTERYLEQTFHHEFSSILYRNHPGYLNESAWMASNMPEFKYNDPENGVGAIRNNRSSQDLDTALCVKGFLTEYAQSGMENDLNTFAQNMFSPSEGFWNLVDNYPRIAAKFNLMVIFYNRIHPMFTEEYFRRLSN
jgi:hypothetical protein